MRDARPTKRFARRAAVVTVAIGVVLAMGSVALATVPLTTISEDPYTNTSSYHKTQVEPDTYSFGSTIVSVFQTGRFTNGGASNIGWATSSDDGANWTNGFLPGTTVYSTPPGPWARISDPSIAYDAEHDVWLANTLGIDASVTGKAMLVSRSTDGGFTWGNPVTVSQGGGGSFYDKNWIACDNWPSSPFFGNCYVQWDDAGTGNTLKMSRSTDGGLTWSASSVPNASVLGGQPVVQTNGRVVVPIGNAFGSQLQSFISTNGGASYSGPHTIASMQIHSVAGGLRDGGGLASAEVDGAGRVYVVWHDCRFRSGCSANDIVMSTSTDGQNWTSVKRIPIAPTTSPADFFIPGIGVDTSTSGSSADLGLAFYGYPKASCSISTCRLHAGFVSSSDGGATWTAPVHVLGPLQLTWLPDTTLGYMVGDYISTSIAGGKAFPVLANATAGTCQLGQITSCNEFSVTPTGGLSILAGSRPAETGPVVSSGPNQQQTEPRTAF